MNNNNTNKGWVIARGPSNGGLKLHDMIERPLLGYIRNKETEEREPQYSKGPSCYTPVDITLVAKNQYTALKRENRTERPVALLSGYTFILGPEPKLIRGLKARGLIYGLVPDPRSFDGSPIVLSQHAISLMRNKYQAEYDPKTGAGHQTSVNPKAAMIPGYEFDVDDYVMINDPAWAGHKALCVSVLDTKAKFLLNMFGIDMEVELEVDKVRKAG